jgi:hypothetical protein
VTGALLERTPRRGPGGGGWATWCEAGRWRRPRKKKKNFAFFFLHIFDEEGRKIENTTPPLLPLGGNSFRPPPSLPRDAFVTPSDSIRISLISPRATSRFSFSLPFFFEFGCGERERKPFFSSLSFLLLFWATTIFYSWEREREREFERERETRERETRESDERESTREKTAEKKKHKKKQQLKKKRERKWCPNKKPTYNHSSHSLSFARCASARRRQKETLVKQKKERKIDALEKEKKRKGSERKRSSSQLSLFLSSLTLALLSFSLLVSSLHLSFPMLAVSREREEENSKR